MKKKTLKVFSLQIPPDLEQAPLIREEALDWLETQYTNQHSFTTAEVLQMAAKMLASDSGLISASLRSLGRIA